MTLNCLISKMRTAWFKPATWSYPGRDPILVPTDDDPNTHNRNSCHFVCNPASTNISFHTRQTSLKVAFSIRVFGYRIHSYPGEREEIDRRTNSRHTLFRRFRLTALPTRRPAMIPIRLKSFGSWSEKTMVKKGFRMAEPFFLTLSNSAVFVRKNERPFPNYHSSETVKRYRPFFRRRARTFRPFFVLMRFRNPWSRFLLRFDGCRYVIDTEQVSFQSFSYERTILWGQPASVKRNLPNMT